MKYKVMLENPPTGYNAGAFTFYRRSEAVACCTAWVENAGYTARLWDGSSWTIYTG